MPGIGTNGGSIDRATLYGSDEDLRNIKTVLVTVGGVAEAFVRTIKHDHVRVSARPDAQTVLKQLPAWITDYNELHPRKALGYPASSSQLAEIPDRCQAVPRLQNRDTGRTE